MSGKCGHQALLHVCGDDKYPSLVETHRFYDLVQSLPNPTRQYPSLIFFLGSGTKSQALHALYPRNKLKTALSEDVARIHIDQRTVRQRSPVLFADADMTLEVRHGSGTGCHYEHALPVTWASSVNHVQTVFDHVVSRVLLATANIFVLFVDDFQDLDRVGQSLRRWIRVGVTSDSPLESRPRLVLVVNEERQSSEDMRSLYIQLELDRLTRLFSLVTTVYLQGDCDTDNFYRPLEVHLHEESRAMREKLIAIGWCFSAIHVERLFRLRLQHVASSQIEEFHHIRAIRKIHPLTASVTSMPLSEVIEYAQHRLISYQSTARLIASSLLLDAFPDGAHLFNSGYVFDTLYTNICRDAVGAIYTRNEHFPSFLTAEIRKSFERHWHMLREQDISALELHRHALGEERKLWRHFKSSKTCVGCLTSKATHVQKCQHALCNACVRAHSSARGTDYQFVLSACPLCGEPSALCVRLKPPTSGVRLLTIDGGGCRGVIPLQFLVLLQERLGKGCGLSDFIDLAVGTSSGGLIVLGMFLNRWSPSDSMCTFEKVAHDLFQRGDGKSGLGPRLQEYLRCWLSDGKYSGKTVDKCFKDAFGESQPMSGWREHQWSSTKVAVTSASVPDVSCVLLTNYVPDSERRIHAGYTALQDESDQQRLMVWQAARATTAAPGYFPPAELACCTLQDGALRYNNPIDIGSREARFIWPENCLPDVVISLGTGTTESTHGGQAPQRIARLPRLAHNFVYGFIPRLTAGVAKQFDGNNAWTTYLNRGLKTNHGQDFRLDVQLENAPPIDDTASMPSLRDLVKCQPGGALMRTELASALLISSFFFELLDRPRYIGGKYHCRGVIRCRNSAPELLSRLEDLCGGSLEFVQDETFLGVLSSLDDICFTCSRFGKLVSFNVASLKDMTVLGLRSMTQSVSRLSGFPQNMQWFVERQGLDACFGTPGVWPEIRECTRCVSSKRRVDVSDCDAKRPQRRRKGNKAATSSE